MWTTGLVRFGLVHNRMDVGKKFRAEAVVEEHIASTPSWDGTGRDAIDAMTLKHLSEMVRFALQRIKSYDLVDDTH